MPNKYKAQKTKRKTREVLVGNIGIGGENPIRVQTMLSTDIMNTEETIKQIKDCVKAGAELIRIATQTPKHAQEIKIIKNKLKVLNINIPIIADIHFSKEAAFEALNYADKIRLNPGNFLEKSSQTKKIYTENEYQEELKNIEIKITPFIKEAKEKNIPLRIGSNLGSLSDRIVSRYGNTSEGMVESAMEYLHIFKKNNFNNLVVALKAADPLKMIEANRILVEKMDKANMNYPIHLGVTEAGSQEEGRTKSIIGIGTLLLDGIGDTIRVSLTEKPHKEIPVCYNILQATQARITKTEFISCPGCGRTYFDIEKVSKEIKQELGHLKGLKIAVMGCIVNGPGEMGDADFGYIGGIKDKVNLYHRQELIKSDVAENKAVKELIKIIKSKNKWTEKKQSIQ